MTKDETTQQEYLTGLLSAIAADGVVEDDELLQIYELFALTETAGAERCKLIEAVWMNTSDFISHDAALALPQDEAVQTALEKDVMLIQSASKKEKARAIAGQLRSRFDLGSEQLAALAPYVAVENAILRGLGAGKEWLADEDSRKEMISRAAAVGVPIGALQAAGIGGLSAVGITSGLASLGTVSGLTVLGLNPMTAGIGALILGGITVKKIADYTLSHVGNDSSNEAALEELKAVRGRTAVYLAEDRAVLTRARTTERLQPGKRARREQLGGAMQRALETAMSS